MAAVMGVLYPAFLFSVSQPKGFDIHIQNHKKKEGNTLKHKKKIPLKKRISDYWHWYILGEYHCDHCPYSWEERYDDDCDAGCCIKGDIQDTCRLIPPVRGIVGFFATKRYIYES